MTTMNDTACDQPANQPCWVTSCVISDSMIPMAAAEAIASGNEVNPPRSAAANAGTISWTSWFGSRNVIGPMSTPANAPRAAPTIQLMPAVMSGEWPMLAAAISPSATAAVTRPNDVNR